jgi:2-amino-4-hydroxy-6-hydroxymethyldihydropteridine diphosphokinase
MAIVALGSNLGDSQANVRRAMDEIQRLSPEPLLRSSLWQTLPVDCPPDSPLFVNAVVGFRPGVDETPESLLAKLQALEMAFGRRPKLVLNEARPLDLDIIVFGSQTRRAPSLILPHPRAHTRRFVMEPLNESVPELVLPGQTRTVREFLQEMPEEPGMRRLG